MCNLWGMNIEIEQFLTINYPKYGCCYCSKELEIPKHQIYKLAKKLQLKANNKIKHWSFVNINPNQFWSISTPEVAYFLGLFWADGYILNYKSGTVTYHRIALEIVSEDARDIINDINKLGKWAIVHRKRGHWKKTTSFVTNNRYLYEFLAENDYEIKSETTPSKILSKIPENLHHYFWRGYFDGDGSLSFCKNGRYKTLQFCGTLNQEWKDLKTLFNKLSMSFSLKKETFLNKKNIKNSCSKIKSSKIISIQNFISYIYPENEINQIGFSRKHKKCKNFIEKWPLGIIV